MGVPPAPQKGATLANVPAPYSPAHHSLRAGHLHRSIIHFLTLVPEMKPVSPKFVMTSPFDSGYSSPMDGTGIGRMTLESGESNGHHAQRRQSGLVANRVDAYRMFKDLMAVAGFSDFAFLSLQTASGHLSYSALFDMHSLAQFEIEVLDDDCDAVSDHLIRHLMDFAAPFTLQMSADEMLDTANGVLRHFSFRHCTAFAFPSSGSGRHAIAFFARKKRDSTLGLGDLMVEAFRRYDRFHSGVLKHEGVGALDDRDRSILSLTSQGMTSLAVAQQLKISEHTVNSHIATLMKRFEVINRPQLIAMAIRTGLID